MYMKRLFKIFMGLIAGVLLSFATSSCSKDEMNQKNITLSVKICSNYPIVNTRSEIRANQIIHNFADSVNLYDDDPNLVESDLIDKEIY